MGRRYLLQDGPYAGMVADLSRRFEGMDEFGDGTLRALLPRLEITCRTVNVYGQVVEDAMPVAHYEAAVVRDGDAECVEYRQVALGDGGSSTDPR